MPKPPRTPDTVTVKQPRIEIDWVTTSIRTILLWGGLIAVIVGMFGYSYYQKHYGPDAPASRAKSAVFEAQDMLLRAREVGSSSFRESIERADVALGEAKEFLVQERWSQAEARALDSQRSSREVLDYVERRRKRGPTAKFVRIHGTVEVKKREESRWVPAIRQMALDPGDLVRTRTESSAQLIFFDGVNLVLSPSSLIEVQLRGVTRDGLNRNPNVHLNAGAVDLSTPKYNIAGTTPSLSTENVEATLRNDTDLRVERNEAVEETNLTVSGTGGADLVSSGGERAVIGPREGARVEGSGEEVRTVKRRLPRTPLLVLPKDLMVYHEIPSEVALRWQNISESERYHVQISDSSLWAKTILDRNDITGEPALTVKGLSHGEFYWRVASVDSNGNESAFSQYRKFSIPEKGTEVTEQEDDVPPKLMVLRNMVFENIVIISGKTDPGVTVTVNDERVDVEEGGDFTHFTVLYKDGVNDVRVVARDAAGNRTRRTIRVNVAVF